MIQKSIPSNYFSRIKLSLLIFSILFTSTRNHQYQNFDNFKYEAFKTSEIINTDLYIISNDAILFKNAYGNSDIQLKERIDSKRGIEGMFRC